MTTLLMSHGMLCSTVHWGDFEFSAELRKNFHLFIREILQLWWGTIHCTDSPETHQLTPGGNRSPTLSTIVVTISTMYFILQG